MNKYKSEYVGWTQLALSRYQNQALEVMVMNLWVSQNSSELLHQMRNYQLVKAVSVCSFNHSSTAVSLSLYVAAFLHLLQQLCETCIIRCCEVSTFLQKHLFPHRYIIHN